MPVIETNQDIENSLLTQPSNNETKQLDSLTYYILSLWEKAKQAKQKITPILIKCERSRKCEYEPDKLSELRNLFGQTYEPPFIPLTLSKCLASEAWIREILFESSQPPFDVMPTPEPEIQDYEIEEIMQDLIWEASNTLGDEYINSGSITDYEVGKQYSAINKKMRLKLKEKIREKSKEIAREVKYKIDDQLLEGNWYSELRKVIFDIVTFPAGIFCGPYFTKNRKIKIINNNSVISEEITPKFRRVSPYNIFPSPDSSNTQDGYLFELVSFTKDELYNLMGLTGSKDGNIQEILDKYRVSGYKISLDSDSETAEIHNKDVTFVSSDNVDCIVFWGKIFGSILKEWGIQSFSGTEIDDFRPYDVCAWIVDKTVLRVILNPDPIGRKPYHKVSFFEFEDSFWGMGIPQVLFNLQSACNSIARNILLNSAFSSGPISEVNIDRLADGEIPDIHPYKTYQVTSQQMLESPVVRFNQSQLVADRLIMVYRHFSQIADEVTIPAYAYGNPSSSVGRTASGLAMLREGASMTIKNVISAIDMNIIQPSIEQLYNYDLMYNILEDIPDSKIWATGSSILVLKQQKARELMELLNFTNNPNDLPYINREKLLEAVVEAKGLDITEILKEGVEQQMQMNQQQDLQSLKMNNPELYNSMTGGSMPTEKQLDLANNPVAGQDVRKFGNGEQ